MSTVAQTNTRRTQKSRGTSATIGRPPIDGLVAFNLRMHRDHRAALERICETERRKRHDPTLTLTDLVREALTAYAAAHDPKATR